MTDEEKIELGEAALKGLLDRGGIKHPLQACRDEDPEIWREILIECADNITKQVYDENLFL